MLTESEKLALGTPIISFNLKGVDDVDHSIGEFTEKEGILVVFTCNHCPYAKAAWPILVDLYKEFGENIGFVAINSNDTENYPEDSFEKMKIYSEELGVEFPYLIDESQDVAKSYKAVCTPDPFLFKKDDGVFKLFYHGRINDNWQEPDSVTEENLKEAMDALLNSEKPPAEQPSSMGCSIKWFE